MCKNMKTAQKPPIWGVVPHPSKLYRIHPPIPPQKAVLGLF